MLKYIYNIHELSLLTINITFAFNNFCKYNSTKIPTILSQNEKKNILAK